MRKLCITGRLRRAGAILSAAIMLASTAVTFVEPVRADELTEGPVIAENLSLMDGANGGPSGGTINKNPYGEDYIAGCQFSIPSDLKEGLGGYDWMKLQVTATVRNYTPLTGENFDEKGNPLTPIVYIYGMDSKYENWNQENYDLTEDPQTVEMELDMAPYIAEGTLGEIGMKVAGCEVGSPVEWEVTSVKIIGEGEAEEVEETHVELRYDPSGEKKDIAQEDTEAAKHGKLRMADVDGYSAPIIVDKDNQPYQLRGVSTHGLSWFPQYVNEDAFQTFRDYWGVNLVRITVYAHEGENAYVNQYAKELTENEGHEYVEGQNQEYNDELIQKGVQAATDLGMYAIIDWHVLNYNPNEDLEDATAFFQKYATMYKDYDNVMFEVCNEPTGTEWFDGSDNDIYSYCTKLTDVIRGCGNDAIVICGTGSYSSEVNAVAGHLLEDKNTVYACHFYAASHYADPMKKLTDALAGGVPVIVSEFGVCTASGDGRYDLENADEWLDICDKNNVSYACWAISNSYESAAYFQENLPKYDGDWTEEDLTPTSKYIINRYNDLLAGADGSQPADGVDIGGEDEGEDAAANEKTDDASDSVSAPAEPTGSSPVVPIVIVCVIIIIAGGAFFVVKGKKK